MFTEYRVVGFIVTLFRFIPLVHNPSRLSLSAILCLVFLSVTYE